jgi:hypothetical protein
VRLEGLGKLRKKPFTSLGKHVSMGKDDIKLDIKVTGWEYVDLINLVLNRHLRLDLVNKIVNICVHKIIKIS